MTRRDPRFTLLVAATAAAILGLGAALVHDVGRPYPGFFFAPDYRIFPVSAAAIDAGFAYGDRIVGVNGQGPTALMAQVRASPEPVRYEVVRDGRRFAVALAPEPLPGPLVFSRFAGYFAVSAVMLAVGVFVFAQNPAALPNQRFLVYMCLWAASNVAVPEAVLGPGKYGSWILGLLPVLLAVHGWVFFLTYPVNPAREAWLERHRVIPRLYRAAFAFGLVLTLVYAGARLGAPDLLASGGLYGAAAAFQSALSWISFPIKVGALIDTRRRAASPLVNQQTTVLLLGIALGLGGWIIFMLPPLRHQSMGLLDPQVGSAFILIYPLSIAYATVRYRLFDAGVALRRSVVYTLLAGLITGAYALAIAGANALLAHADLARSPWFSAAFMFAVALAFNPLRVWLRRLVDRTFFRERYDGVRTIQALARSMRSLLDLEEITRRVTTTVESALHATRARLVVDTAMPEDLAPALAAAPGALSRYQVAADPRFAEAAPRALAAYEALGAEVVVPLRFQEGLRGLLAAAPGALSRYQVAADPRFAEAAPRALAAYEALGAEVVVPLRFQEGLRGLLVLGPKRSEQPYTADDLTLLETLADQAAVAVANAEAHARVVDYAHELERSVMIRSNLAKFVPRRVRELIEDAPEAPLLDKREADVTVLFADISGYTRLSSRLAPEALGALVERYFGAFLDEIIKRGGDVNETAGDGVMVIFHESDHAGAALDAARAIHRRTAELNAELPAGSEALAMHIGVNTGPALLGATKIEGRAGTRWTYTASGLTTNIAARLATVARDGEIVLSDSTLARLGDAVAVEDLGLRELKNVETPIRLYRLGE